MNKKPLQEKQLGRLPGPYKRRVLPGRVRVLPCASRNLRAETGRYKRNVMTTDLGSTSSLDSIPEVDGERSPASIEISDISEQSDGEPFSPIRRHTAMLSPVMSYYHKSQRRRPEDRRHQSFEEVVFIRNGETNCVDRIGNTKVQGRKGSVPIIIQTPSSSGSYNRSKSVENLVDSDSTSPRMLSIQDCETGNFTRSMEVLATCSREAATSRKTSMPHLTVPTNHSIPVSSSMGALAEETASIQQKPSSAMRFRQKRILSDCSYETSRSKSADSLFFESKQEEARHYNRLKLNSTSQPPKDKRAIKAIRMLRRQTKSEDRFSPAQHPLARGFRNSTSMQNLDSGLDEVDSQKSPTQRFRKESHGSKLHRISLNKSLSFNALGDTKQDYVNCNVSRSSPNYVNWAFALINQSV